MKRILLLLAVIFAVLFSAVAEGDDKEDSGSRTAAEVIVKSAEQDMRGFKWKEAIVKLEQSLKLYETAEAHAGLAECYRKRKKREEALHHYNWIVKNVKPKTYKEKKMISDAWQRISRLDPVVKKLADAKEEYIKTLKDLYQRYKDPRVSAVLVELGEEVSIAGAVTFQMATNKPWQDTGIKVQKNGVYLIVVEGSWKHHDQLIMPNGKKGKVWEEYGKGLTSLAVLGKINDKVFEIGSKMTFKAPAEGNLFVRINEGELRNNSGILKVMVKKL